MSRPKQTTAGARAQLRWWTSTGADPENPDLEMVRKRLLARVRELRTKARLRRDLFYRYAEFYGTSLRQIHATERGSNQGRLTFNYAHCYMDTWVSQVCKTRVLPMVATTGASNEQQKKARGLNLFFESEFGRCEVFDNDPVFTRDAGTFGSAIAYTAEDDGLPVVKRVLPTEIDFDEFEWRNGMGRTLYWTVPMDRSVLKERYPELEHEIDMSPEASVDDREATETDTVMHDLVSVRYAWHIKSGKDADDGRIGVFIDSATLAWDSYDHADYPFSFFPCQRPLAGFFGNSIMKELIPGQLEMDFMSERLQEEANLMNISQLVVEKGSGFNVTKDTNLSGGHIEVAKIGQVQSFQTSHNPQLMPYLAFLKENMSAMSTVSPMAAMGEKPTGITAASALELMDDQESERKIVPQRNRERFYVDIAKKLKRVAEELPKYRVLAKDKHGVVDVILSDVNLDDSELMYEVQPTSMVAKTAAARTQQAMDMVKLGALQPDEVNEFLGLPDREAQVRMAKAMKDWIAKELEKALYDGEPASPDPIMNFQLAQKMAGDYLALGHVQEAPEKNLQLIRDFAVEISKLANPQPPPQAAAPPGPPGPPAPGGIGGPTPGGGPPIGAPRPPPAPQSLQ